MIWVMLTILGLAAFAALVNAVATWELNRIEARYTRMRSRRRRPRKVPARVRRRPSRARRASVREDGEVSTDELIWVLCREGEEVEGL